MYQQNDFLCYLNFHYRSLREKDGVFYICIGKVLSRTNFPGMEDRWKKNSQAWRGYCPLLYLA